MIQKIIANNLGKRFNRDWVFRNINFEFTTEESYAILGHNGSGKSTFVQVLSGSITASEGSLYFETSNDVVPVEKIYSQIAFVAPYLELIEEFTFQESIEFQAKFKPFIGALSSTDIIKLSGLEKDAHKQIKYFSSGMKQRVKLCLAILSDTSILFLDEPISNLDLNGINWYKTLIRDYKQKRIIFVCSNQQTDEFDFCSRRIDIMKLI